MQSGGEESGKPLGFLLLGENSLFALIALLYFLSLTKIRVLICCHRTEKQLWTCGHLAS